MSRLTHRFAAAAAVTALVTGLTSPTSMAAGPLTDISGDGSTATPFQLDSAGDLATVASAIVANPAEYAAANYELVADIDFGGETFAGLTLLKGTLDGKGHKISRIRYAAPAKSHNLGFVHLLDGGTIRNLMLDGVTAAATDTTAYVGGFAVEAKGGATLTGNSLVNAALASGGQYAAGLVSNAHDGVRVTNNWVHGTMTSDRYPSAVVGYGRYSVEVKHNVVDAAITATGKQAMGGLLFGYEGAYSKTNAESYITNNVLLDGTVGWTDGSDGASPGRAVRALRTTGFIVADNLANQTILVGGQVPVAPGNLNEHGTDTEPEALARQNTYEDLGFDFNGAWRWEASLLQPVPAQLATTFSLHDYQAPETPQQPDVPDSEIPGVTGEGTQAKPYLVDSAQDLTAMAQAINADPARWGAKHYRLTANIDFGGQVFPGIDTFTGVLDGDGHKVFNISYGPSTTSPSRALIRNLKGGKLQHLTIDGLEVLVSEDLQLAGLVENASGGAVVDGNSVLNATLSTRHQYASAIVANAQNGATITNNWAQGSFTSDRYPGAVVGYARYNVVIRNNLIDAVVQTTGSQGNGALVLAYQGSYSGTGRETHVDHNVVLDGAVKWRTAGAAGRITATNRDSGFIVTDNLANQDVTVGGKVPPTPGEYNKNGTPVSRAQLGQQQTYEKLGWDFTSAWRWDDSLRHPVPARNNFLPGSGTVLRPFELRTAADLRFLAQQLNAKADPSLLGGKHFALSADIDFAGQPAFVGIDAFDGVLDGNNHALANLTYAPSGQKSLALIRNLTGSVTDLVLRNVNATSSTADTAAALAVTAAGTAQRPVLIQSVEIDAARIEAPKSATASGLVGTATGNVTIDSNDVTATVTASRTPAGIVAVARGTVGTNNLVEARLTVVSPGGATGTAGTGTGLVAAAPGARTEIRGNVAYSGAIAYTGKVEGFTGRIVGNTAVSGWSAEQNLADQSILIDGQPVSGPGLLNQHGADATAQQLGLKTTYSGLGWDFSNLWRWDSDRQRPVVKVVRPDELPNRVVVTINGDPRTRRGFSWYQKLEASQPAVMLSTDAAFAAGQTVFVPAGTRTTAHEELVFQAVAEDLLPGTRYYYRVGDIATESWGTAGTFITAAGSEEFSFINLTDTQAKAAAESQLSARTIEAALAHVPQAEFVLHGGDVVQDGHIEQDWIDLLGAAQPSLLNTTIVPAAGNHEPSLSSFVDHFALEAPNGQDTTTGAYYSFTYDGAHFMVLNTNEDPDQAISDAQLSWLRNDARQAREAGVNWLILSIHKGLYTAGAHPEDEDIIEMRKILLPVIDEVGIDLVLQGHDHYLSRTKSLTYDASAPAGGRAVETTKYTEVRNGLRHEYSVSPQGTTYFLAGKAGAKSYKQLTSATTFDLESYLGLFERLGTPRNESAQVFSGITVSKDKLTVDVWQMSGGAEPMPMESFGIDREVTRVDTAIAALPAVAAVQESDETAVGRARQQVNQLNSAQQGALGGLDRLVAIERKLRELKGLVATDGSIVAWADADAEQRQAISVHNSSDKPFTDTPVRVVIGDTPQGGAARLSFVDANGVPLSHEVESWVPGKNSVVWVKVPRLPAKAATTVWAYFGGGNASNDPNDVWSNEYQLVEHFGQDTQTGATRLDSTGQHVGTLIGAPLRGVTGDTGDSYSDFTGSRLQYPGDVGGGSRTFSVSTVLSVTAADLAALSNDTAIAAKQLGFDPTTSTFVQGISKADGKVQVRFNGQSPKVEVPADGKPHTLTQTYDAMTYAVFVDGVEAFEAQAEFWNTLSNHSVQTTIGDFYSKDSSLVSPFRGRLYDVQLAGRPFIPEFEAFRHANYTGNAMRYGPRVARDQLSLALGTPTPGTQVEAGVIPVTGSVTERSVLTAMVAGQEVFRREVTAGDFSVRIPIHALGEQDLTVTAKSTIFPDRTASAVLRLTVDDTVAPAPPTVTDNAAAADGQSPVGLTATGSSDDGEPLEATFHAAAELIPTPGQVTVRTGSTPDRVPDAIRPDSGNPGEDLSPTTAETGANPFQIYRVHLDEAQRATGEAHLNWTGSGDARRVSLWLWDTNASRWVLSSEGSNPLGKEFQLSASATIEDGTIAEDGSVSMLVWRGLTELPWGNRHRYDQMPEGADFDWGFNHVGDTQLYAQATPWMFLHMFDHLLGQAEDRKIKLVIQAGDWVNREYLDDEFQWSTVDPAAQGMEKAGIPYMISWGNHDYNLGRNGRVMLAKYFPMERFAESLKGTEFTWGGSNNIDNYYYTAEIGGAKLLFLTVGFWSAERDDDPGLAWAKQVIEAHPDRTVVLATHHYMVAKDPANPYTNQRINTLLVDPYPNVKLVFNGHNSGSFLATRQREDGSRAYGILTDYQTRAWGGHEYYRTLAVDAENGLLYVNTYSPWLDRTTSDGRWNSPIDEADNPGFHGVDAENYVLEVDLGGSAPRTLTTRELRISVGAPMEVGRGALVGRGSATVNMTAVPGTSYLYWAEVKDAAGHSTRSNIGSFTLEAATPSPTATPSVTTAPTQTVTPEPTQSQTPGATESATPQPTEGPTAPTAPVPTGTMTSRPSASSSPRPTTSPTSDSTRPDQPTPILRPSQPGSGPRPLEAPYEVPGFHLVNGRKWFTTCEPYSQTIRCRTEIWAKQATLRNGRFATREGWVFNNLTYLPYMTRREWGTNPLARTNTWSEGGRRWRTECDTAATGRGGCRSYIWSRVISPVPAGRGGYSYRLEEKWVFNNIVRFSR